MLEDVYLMGCVRDGHSEAMDALYDMHGQRLFHFFLGLTGRRGLSEDLVQEVFLRMFRYRESFRPGSPFLPWMFRIARRLLADHARKHRAEEELGSLDESLPDAREGALQRMERESDRDLLVLALRRLDPEKRELLLLSRDPDLSARDLAALFACSEGAVRVRIHRALEELRGAFKTMVGGVHAMP